MASTFRDATVVSPRTAMDDDTWEQEIADAEVAVTALLEAKRKVLRENPVHEQVLWSRHYDRLVALKRKLDAAVL